MNESKPLTNDEIRGRISNIQAVFTANVDPDRLSDYLRQEDVITFTQWEKIKTENATRQDRCRALLHDLFTCMHNRAFTVVLQALQKENTYIYQLILTKMTLSEENEMLKKRLEQKQLEWKKEKEELLSEQKKWEELISVLDTELKREHKEKLEQEAKVWAEEKEHLMNQIQALQKELSDGTVSELEKLLEQERKVWAEEKERFRNQIQELQNELSGRCKKCSNFEQELELQRTENGRLKEEMQEYNRIIDADCRTVNVDIEQERERERNAWIREKEQLISQTQEMQRSIDKLRFNLGPVLVQTIRTKAAEVKNQSIRGMTILDEELFVVGVKRSEVEVYDSVKLSFSRRWNLKKLIDPYDIGSCNRNKCLYIFDLKGSYGQSKEILRVDPNGKLIKKWSTGDDYGCGLSVTYESNVILTVYNKNKLNEYSSDGQLIREINLSSNAGILHPWHAIKLTSGHVVSHGAYGDDLHRVCTVDADGKLQKSFGVNCGSTIGQMTSPVYLAVDGNGFVMVVDFGTWRVLLLDSDLDFKREILSKAKHGLCRPKRILLDQTNNRLFVADCEENDRGRILIFEFR